MMCQCLAAQPPWELLDRLHGAQLPSSPLQSASPLLQNSQIHSPCGSRPCTAMASSKLCTTMYNHGGQTVAMSTRC